MKTIEIKNVNQFLKYSIPIGMGTTAICFLLPNKQVAKIFFNSYCYDFIWEKEGIKNKFEFLSFISNDTFIGPDQAIIKDGICIGYIYPYIKARTLHNISLRKTVDDLLKSYEKLYEDTKKISELGFQLRDLHDKNILYSNFFRVIDLDKGGESLISRTNEEIFDFNMRKLNSTIIDAIFKVSLDKDISFFNTDIDRLYIDSVNDDYQKFPDFLETLASECSGKSNIKALRKQISYNKTKNNYYSYY